MTRILYPSFPSTPAVTNTYDSLDRVVTQTNAVGGTYQYFFAGYRSEEVDPDGNGRVEDAGHPPRLVIGE